METISRRKNKKYKGEEFVMRVKLDFDLLPENVKNNPILTTIESVKRMFDKIIEKSILDLRQTDMIRFLIRSDGLDKPISTCLMRVSEVSVERVLSVIMRVLQSKEEIRLDEGFTIDVITIRLDVGAGPSRKVTNISTDRLKKHSVLSIPEDEQGLCCAKAIVYGLAHLEKDFRAIAAMKHRHRPALMNRAIKLHEDAGVPIGPCSYIEIAKFETFLDLQIVVVSSENLNKVTAFFFSFFHFLKF